MAREGKGRSDKESRQEGARADGACVDGSSAKTRGDVVCLGMPIGRGPMRAERARRRGLDWCGTARRGESY